MSKIIAFPPSTAKAMTGSPFVVTSRSFPPAVSTRPKTDFPTAWRMSSAAWIEYGLDAKAPKRLPTAAIAAFWSADRLLTAASRAADA